MMEPLCKYVLSISLHARAKSKQMGIEAIKQMTSNEAVDESFRTLSFSLSLLPGEHNLAFNLFLCSSDLIL